MTDERFDACESRVELPLMMLRVDHLIYSSPQLLLLLLCRRI